MDLVTPGIGLVFWTAIVFGLLVLLLAKYAWKPILGAIREREASIENALKLAEKAKAEMATLQADNEKLLAETRVERDKILKEARETRDAVVAEAKAKATVEANKVIDAARHTIQSEKVAAINELKNQVASMSIEIAEKIIRTELADSEKQKALISNLMKEVTLN